MIEETKPAAPMPAGLRYQERAALLEARNLIERNPDAVIAFLVGNNQTPSRALMALALSAQVQVTKQQLETMKVTTALCRFLKVGESTTNDEEKAHGQDATPGS